jgi:hypothetical protein
MEIGEVHVHEEKYSWSIKVGIKMVIRVWKRDGGWQSGCDQ